MHADGNLMLKIQLLSKWIVPEERDVLIKLLEEYEIACRLSRGPVKDRSVHWNHKAYEIEQILTKYIK